MSRLVAICHAHGLRRVLISPGSRNAPLSLSFATHGGFDIHVVPDERAAAFMAIGMAQVDKMPSILVCTSGSAVLDYAPAVAEAYYQRIPLLVISADRPVEWVDQLEGQTMRQTGVLSNFVNKEVDLPQETEDEVGLRFHDRLVNEAITACFLPVPAPVHMNCHLDEPLYTMVDENVPLTKIEVAQPRKAMLSDESLSELKQELESYSKIMLIMGMSSHSGEMESAIMCAVEHGAVVLNETTSNVSIPGVLSCIDRSLEAIDPDAFNEYRPQLVITFGGPLVSKKIKQKLRAEKPEAHWHIDPHVAHIDMFQCLSRAILCDPAMLIQELFSGHKRQDPWFSRTWAALEESIQVKHKAYLDKAPWSDLKVYSLTLPALPRLSKVQLANSAAVRYAQLFDSRKDLSYFSNRGVSGIDGCSSTAVGMAQAGGAPVVLLTGDMAFRYDVNAFWIKDVPSGLKCIVVNNGGGGIFRIIPGPARSGHLEFFEAPMENSAKKVAELNGLDYHMASDEASLKVGLETLFSDERTAILEVFTPKDENADVLMDYFKHLTG